MITHIVMFKLLDRNQAPIVKEVLLGMQGKIPQLCHLEVGLDVLNSERSYDIVLVTKFDSLDDLQAYQVHPVHLEVSNYITTVRKSSVSVDYCTD